MGNTPQLPDGVDSVDANFENTSIDQSQPINLSTKSQDTETISSKAEIAIKRDTNTVTNKDVDRKSSVHHPYCDREQLAVHRQSPAAVAFALAAEKGELKVRLCDRRKNALSNTGVDKDKSREHGTMETKLSDDNISDPFSPTAGPIYMPSNNEHYPPIKSTQMRTESIKSKSAHTPNPIMPLRRRSQNYVDSALKYSPSSVRHATSPVKEKVMQIEARISPVRELSTHLETPQGEPTRSKVKQLAAKLVAAVQGSAEKTKLRPQEDAANYESKLDLNVLSPVIIKKSVSVVEVSSPSKILKAESVSGSSVRSRSEEQVSSKDQIDDQNKTAEFIFSFSEPEAVSIDVLGNSDDTLESMEDIVGKTISSDTNNSLTSSTNGQSSVISDTTFDDSRASLERHAMSAGSAYPVGQCTDESSLPEDDWGQESGVENLSDLKISVSDQKLLISATEDENTTQVAVFKADEAPCELSEIAQNKGSRSCVQTAADKNEAMEGKSFCEDNSTEFKDLNHSSDETSALSDHSHHSEGFTVSGCGEGAVLVVTTGNSQNDVSTGLPCEDTPLTAEIKHDDQVHEPSTMAGRFENAEVELELSGGWDSESCHDDLKCTGKPTDDIDVSSEQIEMTESEGWDSDMDTVEQERSGSLSKFHTIVTRVETPDLAELCTERNASQSQSEEELLVGQKVVFTETRDEANERVYPQSDGLKENNKEVILGQQSDLVTEYVARKTHYREVPDLQNDRIVASVECDKVAAIRQDNILENDILRPNVLPSKGSVSLKEDSLGYDTGDTCNSHPNGEDIKLRQLDENFIDGTECDTITDEPSDEDEPLCLYLPSSQYTDTGESELDVVDSTLVGSTKALGSMSSDEKNSSEPGSPVFTAECGLNEDNLRKGCDAIETKDIPGLKLSDMGHIPNLEQDSIDEQVTASFLKRKLNHQCKNEIDCYEPNSKISKKQKREAKECPSPITEDVIDNMNLMHQCNDGHTERPPPCQQSKTNVERIATPINIRSESIDGDNVDDTPNKGLDYGEKCKIDLDSNVKEWTNDFAIPNTMEELTNSAQESVLKQKDHYIALATTQTCHINQSDTVVAESHEMCNEQGQVTASSVDSQMVSSESLSQNKETNFSGISLTSEIKNNFNAIDVIQDSKAREVLFKNEQHLNRSDSHKAVSDCRVRCGENYTPETFNNAEFEEVAELNIKIAETGISATEPNLIYSKSTIREAASLSTEIIDRNPIEVTEKLKESPYNTTSSQSTVQNEECISPLSFKELTVSQLSTEIIDENRVEVVEELQESHFDTTSSQSTVPSEEGIPPTCVKESAVSLSTEIIEENPLEVAEELQESHFDACSSQSTVPNEEGIPPTCVKESAVSLSTEIIEKNPLEVAEELQDQFDTTTSQSTVPNVECISAPSVKESTVNQSTEIIEENPLEVAAELECHFETFSSQCPGVHSVDESTVSLPSENVEENPIEIAEERQESHFNIGNTQNIVPNVEGISMSTRKVTLTTERVRIDENVIEFNGPTHEAKQNNVMEQQSPQLLEKTVRRTSVFPTEIIATEPESEHISLSKDYSPENPAITMESSVEWFTERSLENKPSYAPENSTNATCENVDAILDKMLATKALEKEEQCNSAEFEANISINTMEVSETLECNKQSEVDDMECPTPCVPFIRQEEEYGEMSEGKRQVVNTVETFSSATECDPPEVLNTRDSELADVTAESSTTNERFEVDHVETRIEEEKILLQTDLTAIDAYPVNENLSAQEEAELLQIHIDKSCVQVTKATEIHISIQGEIKDTKGTVFPVEEHTVERMTTVEGSSEFESVDNMMMQRPRAWILQQDIPEERASPVTVVKGIACSKKAVASSVEQEIEDSTSNCRPTNACELVEVDSQQKTSPMKKNSTHSLEEKEEFVDALTGADVNSIPIQVADFSKEYQASVIDSEGLEVQQMAELETENDTVTRNDATYREHKSPDELCTASQDISTDHLGATATSEAVTERGHSRVLRVREVDCIGLPTPPKRRKIAAVSHENKCVSDHQSSIGLGSNQSNLSDTILNGVEISSITCENEEPTAIQEQSDSSHIKLDLSVTNSQCCDMFSSQNENTTPQVISQSSVPEIPPPCIEILNSSRHSLKESDELVLENQLEAATTNADLKVGPDDEYVESTANNGSSEHERSRPLTCLLENTLSLTDNAMDEYIKVRAIDVTETKSDGNTIPSHYNLDEIVSGDDLPSQDIDRSTVIDSESDGRTSVLSYEHIPSSDTSCLGESDSDEEQRSSQDKETDTDVKSDLEYGQDTKSNQCNTQEANSYIAEPILCTQQLEVDKNYGEKQDIYRSEPSEKRIKLLLDEPTLMTQDQVLHSADEQRYSTQSSVELISQPEPDTDWSVSDVVTSRRSNIAVTDDIDDDKENRPPQEYVDMSAEDVESETEDFIIESSSESAGFKDFEEICTAAAGSSDLMFSKHVSSGTVLEHQIQSSERNLDVTCFLDGTTQDDDELNIIENTIKHEPDDDIQVVTQSCVVQNTYEKNGSDDDDVIEVSHLDIATECSTQKVQPNEEDIVDLTAESKVFKRPLDISVRKYTILKMESSDGDIVVVGQDTNTESASVIDLRTCDTQLVESHDSDEDVVLEVMEEPSQTNSGDTCETQEMIISDTDNSSATSSDGDDDCIEYEPETILPENATSAQTARTPYLTGPGSTANEDGNNTMQTNINRKAENGNFNSEITSEEYVTSVDQQLGVVSRLSEEKESGSMHVTASEDGTSVDPFDHLIKNEEGQFDDADDDVIYYEPNMPHKRKSPKAVQTRPCRSVPYRKPQKLGQIPTPSRGKPVATGRSIIRQSFDEASALLVEFPRPGIAGRSMSERQSLSDQLCPTLSGTMSCTAVTEAEIGSKEATQNETVCKTYQPHHLMENSCDNSNTRAEQLASSIEQHTVMNTNSGEEENNLTNVQEETAHNDPGAKTQHNDLFNTIRSASDDVEIPDSCPEIDLSPILPHISSLYEVAESTVNSTSLNKSPQIGVSILSQDWESNSPSSSKELISKKYASQDEFSIKQENLIVTIAGKGDSNLNFGDSTNKYVQELNTNLCNCTQLQTGEKRGAQFSPLEHGHIQAQENTDVSSSTANESENTSSISGHKGTNVSADVDTFTDFMEGDGFSAPPINMSALYTPEKKNDQISCDSWSFPKSIQISKTETVRKLMCDDVDSVAGSTSHKSYTLGHKTADEPSTMRRVPSESEYDSESSPQMKKRRLVSNEEFDNRESTSDSLLCSQAREILDRAKQLIIKKEEPNQRRLTDSQPAQAETVSSSTVSHADIMQEDSETTDQTLGNLTVDSAQSFVESIICVMDDLKELFCSRSDLKSLDRVKNWIEVLEELYAYTKLPDTIIGVVGNTGAGKSSLLNALLDQTNILPTSGMQACTAVVVQIGNNPKDHLYRADVHFLSEKEWYDELAALLLELTNRDGIVKYRRPDPDSEAAVAFSKVYAVYGQFPDGVKMSYFERRLGIDSMLGKVKHLSSSNPEEFKRKLDQYIEARNVDGIRSGVQHWPLIKQVNLYMPGCKVCSTGAKLVDLPGTRDSNAARDKVARDFIRRCNTVWIVSDITRAIDDKTARDLLGGNFRRQLLMDGQYGALSFVCTKTDTVLPSEIMRVLPNGTSECKVLQEQIELLEAKKKSLNRRIEQHLSRRRKVEESIESMEEKMESYQKSIQRLVDVISKTDEITEDKNEFVKTMRNTRKVKDEEEENCKENRKRLKDIASMLKECRHEVHAIENEIPRLRKAIFAICSKARNEYSKTQIKKDFKAGIRAMRREAGINDDDEIDEYDSDDDDDDIRDIAEKLKVFCVSSTEYLKMKMGDDGFDGPSVCFSNVEETGIPCLKRFVTHLTGVRRLQATDKLIRKFCHHISDIHAYIADTRTKSESKRSTCKGIIDEHFVKLQTRARKEAVHDLQIDMDNLFEVSLRIKVRDGSWRGKREATETATKWGRKRNKENPKEGGYPWSTYRATICRDGMFKSPSYGPIDFNEDLSSPMLITISVKWERIFSVKLWRLLEDFKRTIIQLLEEFCQELSKDLSDEGIEINRIDFMNKQQLSHAENKLEDVISALKEYVSERQREISRIITPHMQHNMKSGYEDASKERGPGCFIRMKNTVVSHTEHVKDKMFDSASENLLSDLCGLQDEIMTRLQEVVRIVLKKITAMYEPFWEAPTNLKRIRDAYQKDVVVALKTVEKLCIDANIVDLDNLFSRSGVVPSSSSCTVDTKDMETKRSTESQRNQSPNAVMASAKRLLQGQSLLAHPRSTNRNVRPITVRGTRLPVSSILHRLQFARRSFLKEMLASGTDKAFKISLEKNN